jgi:Tol biopolymer transport system component
MEYDLETKKEKRVYREISGPTFLAFSPDGQFIAFQTMNKKTLLRGLSIMPATGGECRDVMRLNKGETITTLTWMPDGKNLLFAKRKEKQQKCGLWKVSVDGGEPQNLGLAMERLANLRIHPDGQRIAFCSSHLNSEIWMMENFLPKKKNK